MNFIDRIESRIASTRSSIIAGFDPLIETFPDVILSGAAKKSTTDEDFVFHALADHYSVALRALADLVCSIKPNIAFFEQYGVGGLRGFRFVCDAARDLGIPVVADIKRGDIGSTAQAYSTAFFGSTTVSGRTIQGFPVDAITINPYLGFDTVEVFLKECEARGTGIFVLVRTSNPGSADIQCVADSSGVSVADRVATWIEKNSPRLAGTSSLSGLGAVVGATHPDALKVLRASMPHSLLLIPGVGAQGGTPADVAPGFLAPHRGAIINLSRALMSSFSAKNIGVDKIEAELREKASHYNGEMESALSLHFKR